MSGETVTAEEFLARDNSALRAAGGRLAKASLHVIHNYDGLHRLALAVAEWSQTIADEGGRPHGYGLPDSNNGPRMPAMPPVAEIVALEPDLTAELVERDEAAELKAAVGQLPHLLNALEQQIDPQTYAFVALELQVERVCRLVGMEP